MMMIPAFEIGHAASPYIRDVTSSLVTGYLRLLLAGLSVMNRASDRSLEIPCHGVEYIPYKAPSVGLVSHVLLPNYHIISNILWHDNSVSRPLMVEGLDLDDNQYCR